MSKAYLFPGQGAQFVGMGKDLYESNAKAKELFDKANEILGFTKMNWNSFNLYTKLPATIDSSAILARVGKLLSKYEGKTYDYRYFI